MYNKTFKKIPAFLFNLYKNRLLKSYPNYQPVFCQGEISKDGDRNCLDRWELIKKEVIKNNAESFLDLGCAEGFYVLQAARQCGCVSLGIDADVRRLAMAQNQIISEKIKPAGFMLAVLDEDLLGRLPKFDAVIFMSVMHHMMYTHGPDFCKSFLQKLKDKIGKFMIFEMGQSNETKNNWAKDLPDMGDNPHEWIKDFIMAAGFSRVEKIGSSDSYKKDQNRAIFIAFP